MTQIYLDGAFLEEMKSFVSDDQIQGFTTNPTLMRQAGVTDYVAFCKEVLNVVRRKPISFEVFSDDLSDMERQARVIASWDQGNNVYVKIPVTNSVGESTAGLIRVLASDGIKLNITAVFDEEQVTAISAALNQTPAIVSVFAGRIADTGRDPLPILKNAKNILKAKPSAKLLWASPREVLNIYQAQDIGCDIITVTRSIYEKMKEFHHKDLKMFSLDTVKMFKNDAEKTGFHL